ncbi:NUDIX hydrolase [Bacillus infantis]|uniref:NUDIX hydrolase n=1 Tax=Bacillus infantis TaxID=324767 RepID=UPI003CEAB2D4
MIRNNIRAIAICVFRKDDSILVAEGFDKVKQDYFYRPIGGGIEFGEKSTEALEREVLEEIGESITNLIHLGTIENIFTYNGVPRHEIVFIYDGEFSDQSIYQKSPFQGLEDNGESFRLMWKPISDFQNKGLRLVPEELLSLIQ